MLTLNKFKKIFLVSFCWQLTVASQLLNWQFWKSLKYFSSGKCLTFHDGSRYHVETSLLVVNGFYMITAFFMKGLRSWKMHKIIPLDNRNLVGCRDVPYISDVQDTRDVPEMSQHSDFHLIHCSRARIIFIICWCYLPYWKYHFGHFHSDCLHL